MLNLFKYSFFSKVKIISIKVKQRLRFQVYHDDRVPKLIGHFESSVGQIFGSPDNGLVRELTNQKHEKQGKIIIRFEKIPNDQNKQNIFQIRAQNLPNLTYWYFFGGTSPFFRIIRKRKSDELLIYESQVIMYNRNPTWKQFKISDRKLCSSDENKQIQIRIFNYSSDGNHTLIGNASFRQTLLDFKRVFEVKNNTSSAGKVIFEKVKRQVQYEFGNFLEKGLQLALVTCIDFTASNGDPQQKQSLHYVSKVAQSPYQRALQEIIDILLDYDYDKLVPVYGFGAKVKMPTFDSNGLVHHCFPLNGYQQNPNFYKKDGIMNGYRNSFKYLKFSGPTLFGGLFEKAIEECKQFQKDNNQYMILFILTDGQIHDKQKVIDQIVRCNKLPISVIIVGIGKGDFQIMHELDDDNCEIVDSHGNPTTRDLVQFVQFQGVKNDSIELARQVLQELPRQVSEYFMDAGIKPQDIRKDKCKTDIQLQMLTQKQLRQK